MHTHITQKEKNIYIYIYIYELLHTLISHILIDVSPRPGPRAPGRPSARSWRPAAPGIILIN